MVWFQVKIKQKRKLNTDSCHYSWKVVIVSHGDGQTQWCLKVLDHLFLHLLYIQLIFLTASPNDQQRLWTHHQTPGYRPHGESCIKATASHKPLYVTPTHSLILAAADVNFFFFNLPANSKLSLLTHVLVGLTNNIFCHSLTFHLKPSVTMLLPHL